MRYGRQVPDREARGTLILRFFCAMLRPSTTSPVASIFVEACNLVFRYQADKLEKGTMVLWERSLGVAASARLEAQLRIADG